MQISSEKKWIMGMLAFLLQLQLACSQLSVQQPLATIEDPQPTPQGKWRYEFSATPSRLVQVTSNAGARPPVFNPKTNGSSQLKAHVIYGITDWWDLGVGIGNVDENILKLASFQLKTKFDLLNSSASSSPFLWGLYLLISTDSNSNRGDQQAELGNGGYPWKGTLTSSNSSTGTSLGYKFSTDDVFFIGYASGQSQLNAEITQEASTTGDSAGGSYNYHERTQSTAYGLGFVINSGRVKFVPVLQYNSYNFEGGEKINGVYAAVYIKATGN